VSIPAPTDEQKALAKSLGLTIARVPNAPTYRSASGQQRTNRYRITGPTANMVAQDLAEVAYLLDHCDKYRRYDAACEQAWREIFGGS
jgi:hypothetical protein